MNEPVTLTGSAAYCADCARPLAPGATWLWVEPTGVAVLVCPQCWDARERVAELERQHDAQVREGVAAAADAEVVVVVRMPAGTRAVEEPLTGLPDGAVAVAVTGVAAQAVLAVLDRRTHVQLGVDGGG